MSKPVSRRQDIRNRALNMLVGPAVRQLDSVLDVYIDQNGDSQTEAKNVIKLVLATLAAQVLGDSMVVMDSAMFRMVRERGTERLDIRPVDEHAVPGHTPQGLKIKQDEAGNIVEDEAYPEEE